MPFGEKQAWISTADVNSLVRDKGSNKIRWYLRRRSCSSRAMRLDLVMLIIDRRVLKVERQEVWAGGQVGRGWAVGGKRQGPGGTVEGDPLLHGAEEPEPRVTLGGPHIAGWAGRKAETWA